MNPFKKVVVSKSFLEKYYENYIEKALSHKYIRKIPNSKGGYYYIYPKDFAKPIKVLLSVFGMKEEKIDDVYARQNIQSEYGADKKTFAAHLLEYLSNRATWNKFFGDKFNRDKYKDPVKFEAKKSELKENIKNGKVKTAEKKDSKNQEGKEKNFKSKWNNTLMRKIYSMYNPVPEDKKVETSVSESVSINAGDRVSYNGKSGVVDESNGRMAYVKFDDGTMGRFKVADLQNLDISNEEAAAAADENANEQNHDGTQKSEEEKTGLKTLDSFTQTNKEDTLKVLDRLYAKGITKENDLFNALYHAENGASEVFDAVTDERRITMPKAARFSERLVSELPGDNEKAEKIVRNIVKNYLAEHENRSKAMMGNQNARKDGGLDEDLIRNANGSSNMYEAGDAINREYLGGLEAIDSFNVSDEEKENAKKKLFELSTEELKAQAGNISVSAAGPARKVTGSDKAFKKVQKIRGEKQTLLNELRTKSNQNDTKEENKAEVDALADAVKNNKLAFVKDGKVYYRANSKSGTWNVLDYIPEIKDNKTIDEKKKELKELNAKNKTLGFADPEKAKTLDKIEKLKGEIAFMNTDEYKNRSEAMKDNDNAAGKHNVKPQTDSEMKKEQAETKKAREEAGLPKIGINYGERVSAMEDAVSLNPNAENYAYKDTGYIAGSQKEKIQDFWKNKKESGEGTSIEEIDWNTLEENPRYAKQQITKENILGDVDYSKYKEKGMKPEVAYLISRVFAAIPKEPVGNSVDARKNYVIAINTIKDRLENCNSIKEVQDVIDDVYGEYEQTYDSQIARNPKVKEIAKKQSALRAKSNNVRLEIMQWARNELVPAYKEKAKKERTRFYNFKDDIQKELNKKVKEYDPSFEGDIYFTLDGSDKYWPVHMDGGEIFRKEKDKVYDELKAERAKAKSEVESVNTTHDVWKELGEKFCKLRYSKTYQTHCQNLKVYEEDRYLHDKDGNYIKNPDGSLKDSFNYKYRDKTYDRYEGWTWVEKKKIVKEKSDIIEGLAKRKFEMIVPPMRERIGGRNVSVKSTEELKKAFNFRDIQTGTYVQTDPVSAKWHVDNLAASFADLADVLGIRDDQISLNGRLAVAIGARGHGEALAHYEAVQRVINITKMKGGGSLGHEWFHSFDNMITEAMNGGNYAVYMSDPHHASKAYRMQDYFKKDNVMYDPIPEDESTQKVKEKFDNLVKAMKEGDTPETEVVTYKPEDVAAAINLFEGKSGYIYSYYGDNFFKNLQESKTLDDAINVINAKYKSSIDLIHANMNKLSNLSEYDRKRLKKTIQNYEKYRSLAVAYFDKSSDKAKGGEAEVKTGRTVSRFYQDAKFLDGDKEKPYWSTPLEMAARSFEAYLVDKLKAMGRRNDYLSGSANNDVYEGRYYPYPTERDRIKINKAFDELFEVIRSENAIRKAIDILDRFIEKSDKPRFIIKGGRFLIRK